MDRIYMNRIDGQRRIHIEIHDHEISDLLEDLQADPEHYDSTRAFLAIREAADLAAAHNGCPCNTGHTIAHQLRRMADGSQP